MLCASEATNRLGGAAGSALPVASRPGDNGTFAVDVKLASGNAVCVIDANGSIVSLTRS